MAPGKIDTAMRFAGVSWSAGVLGYARKILQPHRTGLLGGVSYLMPKFGKKSVA